MSEHFFSRWSQRKQAVSKGLPVAEPTAPMPLVEPAVWSESAQRFPAAERPAAVDANGAKTSQLPIESRAEVLAEPLPSLDDAHALSPASDFQPFMRPGVAADVRNVAMKKLFTDPHFNVMDGLDIYIGDYNTPDPLPAGMLQKMVGAKLLNLFPDEAEQSAPKSSSNPETNPGSCVTTPNATTDVAQSDSTPSHLALPATDGRKHDDPDFQLQPNHDPASSSAVPDRG
jgi:hypothetical protein